MIRANADPFRGFFEKVHIDDEYPEGPERERSFRTQFCFGATALHYRHREIMSSACLKNSVVALRVFGACTDGSSSCVFIQFLRAFPAVEQSQCWK